MYHKFVFHTSDGTYITTGRTQPEAYQMLLEHLKTADIAINGCYKVKEEVPLTFNFRRNH